MVVGKSILGVVFWCYGVLLMDLPCMMGICGTYMSSDMFMSYMVIEQFLILLVLMDYFSVCIDGHTMICWGILDLYTPLVSSQWKYSLLISTVFRKF